MTGRPIVFLDTETDGLHPGRRAWEIAMIRRAPDGSQKTCSLFVRIPHSNSDVKGLQIGGYFERHPEGRKLSGQTQTPNPVGSESVMSAHDAAKLVMQWTFGATIVGAVPSFDTETLERMLRSEGLVPAWHHRVRCVEALASGFVRRELGGLADCMSALGLNFPQAEQHTALGDARAAMRIWDAVMGPAATEAGAA